MTYAEARNKDIRLPELLAPAGSPEAFRAAISAGADAVYLSGKQFGARKFAANFTDNEIEETVRLAHTRGVRVYVTVNTLVHDNELAGVTEYLIWLYSIGVDAVLVQDEGLVMLARELVPGLVLHASTQMTVHNAAGVRRAAELGFRRVVLARELSLGDVQVIAKETKDTGIGLEVFAHGALCYSWSGQCLLSSIIGGRSGNRGTCAQPCRKPWSFVTGTTDKYGRPEKVRDIPARDRYLLSPKDLCTYRNLKELVNSPVVSLKIEGRMKSPDYVAIVVSTYRRALDTIAAGTWEPSDDDERDLLLAFNRGFSKGYLFGDRHRALMGRDAPDNRGLFIGTVLRYDKAESAAVIRQDCPMFPETGDGLLITHPDHPGETGFALNTTPQRKKDGLHVHVPRAVKAGSSVFITSSRALDSKARRILAKPPENLLRPVLVDLVAEADAGGIFSVCGTITRPDGRNIPVTCRPHTVLTPAGSSPLSRDDISQQLRKSGGTPFVVRFLDLAYDGKHFAPVREINRVRREFFAAAEEQLAASYRPPMPNVRHAQRRWLKRMAATVPETSASEIALRELRLAVWAGSADAVRQASDAGADRICFEPDLYLPARSCHRRGDIVSPEKAIIEALEICNDAKIPLIWKLPRIVPDTVLNAAMSALPGLTAAGLSGVMTDDRGAASEIRKTVPGIRIEGATGLNIFNHASAIAAAALFSSIVLSPELSRDELQKLLLALHAKDRAPGCAVIVQGTVEAMVTEDCLTTVFEPCAGKKDGQKARFHGIRDEKGVLWPVFSGNSCRTTIGSASEVCLIIQLPQLLDAGIDEVIIDARHRPPEYTGAITALYRKAVNDVNSGRVKKDGGSSLALLKKEAAAITPGGITTGHFLHGLKE